jgi:hypothetical protein
MKGKMTANNNWTDRRFRSSLSTGAIPKEGLVPPPPPRRRSSSGARTAPNPPPSKPSPIAPSSDDFLINETTEITSGLVSQAKAWLDILETKSQSQSFTTDAGVTKEEEQRPMTTRHALLKGNAISDTPEQEVWCKINDLQHSVQETRSKTDKCDANLNDMKSECRRIAKLIDLLESKSSICDRE